MINNPKSEYVYIKVRREMNKNENLINHLKIVGYGALFGIGSILFTYSLVYLILL